jgi:hypothetical protein
MLTLGLNIGWLPGNHTTETDLRLTKILSSASMEEALTEEEPAAASEPTPDDEALVPDSVYEKYVELRRHANSMQLARSWSRSSISMAPEKPPRKLAGRYPQLLSGSIAASLKRAASVMMVSCASPV